MVAAELRAEMARQGVSQREMARRLGVSPPRMSARVGLHATMELTFADVLEMTEALNVSVEGFLSPLLPRLDSNQQPSGYASLQVSGLEGVVCLDQWKRSRDPTLAARRAPVLEPVPM